MNSDQLRSFAGLTARQLVYWVDRSWLKPTNPTCGSGRQLEFTGDEARVARTMARLVAAGLKPDTAHAIARGQAHIAPGIWVVVDRIPADLLDMPLSAVAA